MTLLSKYYRALTFQIFFFFAILFFGQAPSRWALRLGISTEVTWRNTPPGGRFFLLFFGLAVAALAFAIGT